MLNIIKLAVGIEDIDHLSAVQERKLADEKAKCGKAARLWHRTRHAPRRAEELLDGGSMYWVIKGQVAARQRLIGFEKETDEEGRKFCFIQLDPELVPTLSRRHRAFQGWRYLKGDDAPPDQPKRQGEEDFPPEMAAELRELGLL
ncbi:MAG: DUF1489 domain-containing protein [Pseudomonadota bacterium]|nr:DUF1489 domain-containing protein [Pseudomonadota bacterium]